jgi:hypothetical protein
LYTVQVIEAELKWPVKAYPLFIYSFIVAFLRYNFGSKRQKPQTQISAIKHAEIITQRTITFRYVHSEFLATDPEARVRFPALPEKKAVGLKRGLTAS